MSIADVIILIVISLGIYHFLTKRKVKKDGRSNEKKLVPGVEKDKRENIQGKSAGHQGNLSSREHRGR